MTTPELQERTWHRAGPGGMVVFGRAGISGRQAEAELVDKGNRQPSEPGAHERLFEGR